MLIHQKSLARLKDQCKSRAKQGLTGLFFPHKNKLVANNEKLLVARSEVVKNKKKEEENKEERDIILGLGEKNYSRNKSKEYILDREPLNVEIFPK